MTSVAFSERLAEAAGPIVVKEVRQGLRARVFSIFFGLLLFGCLVVALIAAAQFDRDPMRDLGPDYFRLFLAALAIVEFFVIPYTAFRAMSREREEETWVLLALTGLGPRRIVRGKITSALAQGLLYASACAPFVLFSYYLNGIDLPTVLTGLVMSAAWSTVLVCLGVAAATQAESRIGRALVHFLLLGTLLAATLSGIAMASALAENGGRLLRDEVNFRVFCGGVVTWGLTSAWVLSEGAAAGLSLVSENSARGPRLALVVQVGLALVVGALVLLLDENKGGKGPGIASVLTSLQLLMAGVFATSERDGFSPAFGMVKGWARPGALRSFSIVMGLLAVSTAAWFALYLAASDGSGATFRVLVSAPAFVAMYLSLGVLLGRLTPLEGLGEPLATRAGFTLATFLGVATPMFLSVLLGDRATSSSINVLNPIIGLGNTSSSSSGNVTVTLASVCAVLFGVLAWSVLSTRDVRRRS